jgi:hypothetical protein
MGLINAMVYKLWRWRLGHEILRLYKNAGETGVSIGEGFVFYDVTANKIKVYIL